MSDPPACPAEIGSALDDLVRRAAHAMDPAHAFSAHGDAQVSTPAQCRADDLARLRAVEALRADLETTADMIARRAGGRVEAPVTYADLGRAVGIGRESARTRWPGAVPDARPGRPPKQITVTFREGPAEWDGYRMEYPASTLDGDLDSIGAYLVVDSAHMPADVPPDARAHYAPSNEDRATWVFQGWVSA